MKNRRFFFDALLLPVTVVIAFSGSARAASGTWTSLASGGAWSNPANWAGAIIADGVGFTADFSTLDITANNTVSFDASHSLGNLLFGDTPTSSNSWILTPSSAGNVLTLQTTGSGVTPSITVNNQTATLNTVVSGSQGFTKNGAGTLTLATNANTWTGTATVNAGTFSAQTGQSNTAGVVLKDGTTFVTNQTLAAGNVISVASGATTFTETAQLAAAALVVGNGNVAYTLPANGTMASFNGFGGVITLAKTGAAQRVTGGMNAPFATFNLNGSIYIQNGGTSILGGLGSSAVSQNDIATGNFFVGSANTNTTWRGGSFSGTGGSFVKVGTGTLVHAPDAGVWTGTPALAVAVDGGVLQANYGLNANNADTATAGIFTPTSALSFGGGQLYLQGKTGSFATAQTMGATTLRTGGGSIVVNPFGGISTSLILGTLSGTVAGGSLNIQPPNVAVGAGTAVVTTTSSQLADGTYGSRITYGSNWTGTVSGAAPFTLGAYAGYNTLAPGFTGAANSTNDQINAATGSLTLASAYTANSLRINPGAGQQLNLGGQLLTLTNGGLLFAGTDNYTIAGTGGSALASGTATDSDLTIQQLGTGNLTIGAAIANGNGASTLTKAGSGTLILTGSNSYTGATHLNGGITSIASNANLGLASAGANLLMNGGTVQATGSFSLENGPFDAARSVLIGGGGGTFDVTGTNVLTVNGPVYNNVANESGPLLKTGSGTLILSNANSYTGATILTGGILSTAVLANGGSSSGIGSSGSAGLALQFNGGTLQYTGDIQSTDRSFTLTQNGGTIDSSGIGALSFTSKLPGMFSGTGTRTLTLAGSNDGTLAAPLGDANTTIGASGAVAIAKAGSGSWTLSGLNTYSGPTTVAAGQLNVTGSLGATAVAVSSGILNLSGVIGAGGSVTVNGGGILKSSGNGTTSGVINGAVTVAGGTSAPTRGAINLVDGSIGTLGVSSLTLGNGGNNSVLQVESGPTSADLITLGAGALNIAGGANITVTNLGGLLSGQTYNLITYGSGTGAGFATGSGTTVGGLTLTNPALTFGVTGSLTVTPTAVQLVTSGASTPTSAYFSGAAGAAWNATNGSGGNFTTSAGSGFVQSYPSITTDVFFAGTGATHLTNNLLGQNFDIRSLTFRSTTGPVTIGADGNTLALESGGLTVQNGAGAATINALMALNAPQTWTNSSTNNLTVNGVISGGAANGLTINNTSTGATIFTAANTYLGGTTLTAGTLRLAGSGTLGDASGGLTVNGGVVDLNGIITSVGNLSGTGGTIVGNSDFDFTFTIGSGNGTGGNYLGTIRNTNSARTGLLSLTKVGSGVVGLGGANTYSGVTSLNGGTLQINSVNNLGDSTATNTLSFNGGTLEWTAPSIADLGATRTIDLPGAGIIQTDVGSAVTISGVVTGSGGLSKSGPGILTLNAADTAAGAMMVNAGLLKVASGGSISGASGVTVGDGAMLAIAGGTVTLPATGTSFFMGGGVIGANNSAVYVSGGSLTYANAGVDPGSNLRGSFTLTGGTVTTGESNMAPHGSDSFSLYVGGNGTYNANQGQFGSFTVGTRGMASAYISGSGSLIVSGAANPANTSNFQLVVGSQFVANNGNPANTPGQRTFVQQGGTVITNGLVLGSFTASATNAPGVYQLNGGVLTTNTLNRGSLATTTGTLNFGGGTFKSGTAFSAAANVATNINSGGATIDTTGGNLTWSGIIASGTSGNVSGFTGLIGGSGYGAAPTVSITGGGGTGASAVAVINAEGQVVDLVITDTGSGYTSAPTFVFTGGGGSGAAATGISPVVGNGGLIKAGVNTLTLSAANSYKGPTSVTGGILAIAAPYLEDSAPVSISASAVLALNFNEAGGDVTDVVSSLIIDGLAKPAGVYGATGSGAPVPDDVHFSGVGTITVAGVAASNYASWATAHGITGQPASGDFDNDGLTNLMEYALGKDPTVSSLPAGTLAAGVLSFTKGTEAVANGDVSYSIEASTALGAAPSPWTAVTPTVNNSTTISYTLPTGLPKEFARLKVTQP